MKRKVRIIGFGVTAYQIVDARNNSILLGFAANYSGCLLICAEHGFEIVR